MTQTPATWDADRCHLGRRPLPPGTRTPAIIRIARGAILETESAISHQLRALRAARLVSYRKEGRQVFYRLHDHHVLELYRTVREHLEE